MHSVQARMWDPRPPSKHAPPHSDLRLTDVTAAAPAKRITFYKSGDSQFGGIRMAVHKRSFKCFDTLLDDLSQKMPLPFGVRTVTTPRGTHTIQHLEQLQDGGCYLCSDRRQARPVNMELASRRPNAWYHHSHSRPRPPETSPATPPGHLPFRQRRILLVKNGEPGMRRSVMLSRRSARSLRAFLDEVSEVMQFHVRKLYTADGRRVDSVQSLMSCPGVLVCVGREAFSPTLVNVLRKSSEEKLPTLGSKSPAGLGPRTPGNGARSPATHRARSPPHGSHSRASEYSEKNVNFGLETKKSIIHPRSDSSNRSTHLSMSSEKSHGVSACSQARPSITNEDIEKRVLVNKDGSLSLEMRVRFRLQNDETLQWSTQVRKSPSLSNECCPLSQAQPFYQQQGQSESCSDPDSTSFDSSQPLQRVSEGKHCPCCYQRQEHQYDLWENPDHSHKQSPVPPPHTSSHAHTVRRHTHSSSSSSSCHSRRVVRCRARLSDRRGGSTSEQSQLVREETCVTEQVERSVRVEQDGDTHVEVCRVSRCCSRSEVVVMDSNPRPLNRKSVEELVMEEVGERPPSAISSSSNVLQSLKEDQDNDSFTASQCCHSNDASPSLTVEAHLNGKPTSDVKHEEERGSRAASAASSCRCGAATPHSTAEAEERGRASRGSSRALIQTSEEEGAADDEDEELKRVASGLSGQTGLSAGSSVCPNCGGCKVNSVSNSRASQRSLHSRRASPKPATPQEKVNTGRGDDGSGVSTQSNYSNHTNHGRLSAVSNVPEGRASSVMSTTATGKEEDRAPRATSATSHRSDRSRKSGFTAEKERSPSAMSAQSSKTRKSNSSGRASDIRTREEAEGEITVDRALTSLSAKSGASSKTSAISATDCTAVEEDDTNKRIPTPGRVLREAEEKENEMVEEAMSQKSNRTTSSPNPNEVDGPSTETNSKERQSEERVASALSVKSKSSVKSSSHKSNSPKNVRSLPPDTNVIINTPVSVDGEGNSLKSAKSGGSKCRCGAASGKKADEEDDEEVKREEASSTRRQRRESGGTEQPLSRRSSGSVSLWLPDDGETAESDSGTSSVSCHMNTLRVKTASCDVSIKRNVEGTGSAMSQKSNNNGSKGDLSPNPPAVDIPTIETPDERNETGEGSGEQKTVRAASALSVKSSRSHKSSCNCSVKAAARMPETGSMKSDPAITASNRGTPNNRTSSAKSSASSKVYSKSTASGGVKKSTKTTPEDSGNDSEKQIVSRSASKAKREEDIADDKEASVHSKSPCCLKPESAASARSDPLNPIKGQKAKSRSSVKTSRSEKKEKQVKSSSPCLLHGSRPHSRAGTCSESTLSQSLSAADLLKEAVATERPRSRTSGKPRSEKSQRSRKQTDQEEDLTPACLPNASPSEVVSDWLRSIPTDGGMLGLGDELHEEETAEETPGGEATKEEESPEGETVEAEEEKEKKDAKCDAAETPPQPKALLLSGESLPRNLHSSAAVMKVLLSSSMGRCQSLPEVSPVYGRRLSTSARGFLDCLAQLQLIEPAVIPEQKSHQYEDIMAILQSLWLTEPRSSEAKEAKDVGREQVSPPRSSSGVDMSSGSGSGKENGNQGGDEKEQNKTSEAESLHDDEGMERVAAGEEEEGNTEEEDKEAEAERGDAETEPAVELEQSGDQTAVPPKAPENPSSSNKSSAHDSSKSPTDNEQETPEDSGSGTPSTVLRAPMSKRPSQDPDPVWILQLLKKLEKQFMNHYSSAMAEFKVRWDLDDSVVLDTMISELRDEVSRRIQSSVEREMKKIQSRAGRMGRASQPPKGGDLSRESTMTEKRRRMLRVMKNQSVKTADSLSDGETAGDFSDQRSEDEYCPCDACVRKKMAARPLKVNPLAAEAPVMMEFDLLKILQLKKSPSPSAAPPPVEEEGGNVAVGEEGRSLEAVQEEEEDETKEDIKAGVVLEETIPEEDEDMEREDGGEAGEDKEVEVGERDGEEEETSENVVEEAQCHCQCAENEEEENDNAGEGGEGETADDEERVGEDAEEEAEESDKEAAAGEGETSENGDEVSESKTEEDEQTTSRESREEENEDDDAANNASNEEECTEGSVGAVAEDEDDTGEGGVSDEQEREAPEEERTSPQAVEDNVEEIKPEEGEVDRNKRDDGALLHQFTRTSVESQPGSMEDIDVDSSPNPVNSIEVPKAAGGGGAGQRRSRSPARVKRRKPKERDEELEF